MLKYTNNKIKTKMETKKFSFQQIAKSRKKFRDCECEEFI